MPEDAGVANLRVLFDELAAVVLQTPANLPVLYPVGSLEKILYIRGVSPEAVCEGFCLGVPDGITPEFNGQFLDYAFLHKNLSGGIVGCHPVNL
jgi:hypothetical protein